jgi:hypothetical protein
VGPRKPLAVAHVRDEVQFEEAKKRLHAAFVVGHRKPRTEPMVLKKVTVEE